MDKSGTLDPCGPAQPRRTRCLSAQNARGDLFTLQKETNIEFILHAGHISDQRKDGLEQIAAGQETKKMAIVSRPNVDPEFCLAIPDIFSTNRIPAKPGIREAKPGLIFRAQGELPFDKLFYRDRGTRKV